MLDAIRADRFWIFPHPRLLAAVTTRAEGIATQQNPSMDLPEELQEHLKVPDRPNR